MGGQASVAAAASPCVFVCVTVLLGRLRGGWADVHTADNEARCAGAGARLDAVQGAHQWESPRGVCVISKVCTLVNVKDETAGRGPVCSAGRSSVALMLDLAQLPSVCVSSREPLVSPSQEKRAPIRALMTKAKQHCASLMQGWKRLRRWSGAPRPSEARLRRWRA